MEVSEGQLIKVLVVPPNKDYIIIADTQANRIRFPRQHARHVSSGDVCWLTSYRNRQRLKLLTDDDEIVTMNHPDRKRLVPYGFYGPAVKTPDPIQTPES